MTSYRASRFALWAIAILMLPTAILAAFAPRSFYDDFPLGRGWISRGGGSYDEHLVRDVGVLFLALVLGTMWTLVRHWPLAAIAAAWLLQGALHLLHHLRHLDAFGAADGTAMIASLAAIPLLAAVALAGAAKDVP